MCVQRTLTGEYDFPRLNVLMCSPQPLLVVDDQMNDSPIGLKRTE